MKSPKKGTTLKGAVLVGKSGSGHMVESIITRPIPAPASSFSFTMPAGGVTVDEGAYSARICAVFDLGNQPPLPGGRSSTPRRQVAVGFELQGALSDGADVAVPPVFYRRFNIVGGAKAELPKLLRAIYGRDVAPGEELRPADWLGKPITAVIEHSVKQDGTTSCRISSVLKCSGKPSLPEMAAAPLLYPGAALSLLPEWAQTAIAAALTPAAGGAAGSLPAGYDDDVNQ